MLTAGAHSVHAMAGRTGRGANPAPGPTDVPVTRRADLRKRPRWFARGWPMSKAPPPRNARAPIPDHLRAFIYHRDGNRCRYCGVRLVSEGPGYPPLRTIDHFVARSKGGDSSPENLVAACSPCNNRKGSRPAEWLIAQLVIL